MKRILSILVLLLAGFSAALLLSPDFYSSVRGLISEQTEGLSLEGISESLEGITEGISLGSDSELLLEWPGLEEFSGDTLYAVLETNTDPPTKIGPFEVLIGDDGVATLPTVEGYDDGKDWDLFYYVDGNGNGVCDEESVDVKRRKDIFSGAVEISMGYFSLLAAPEGLCDHFP